MMHYNSTAINFDGDNDMIPQTSYSDLNQPGVDSPKNYAIATHLADHTAQFGTRYYNTSPKHFMLTMSTGAAVA